MNKPGLSIQLIIDEAKRRGIDVEVEHHPSIIRLELSNHVEYFHEQFLSSQGYMALYACSHKDIAKKYLNSSGLPVAKGMVFKSSEKEAIIKFCKEIGWPVVIKPCVGTHGNNVFLSIDNEKKLRAKLKCFKNDLKMKLLIEKMHFGQEYRILATRDKVIGIINRIPANVIGDGKKTIAELIQEKNQDSRRINKLSLTTIEIDDSVRECLHNQRKNINSVPKVNETVYLRENSNLSTGGDSVDCTDIAHDSVREIAVNAIKAIPGLSYGGLDFLTQDITKDQNSVDHIIIEINSWPMISMHHFPMVGKPRDVAKEIIDLAFPETAAKER